MSAGGAAERPALEVRGLSVSTRSNAGAPTRLLDDVSFEVYDGEAVGVVGESGSGKSLTSLAVLGILPRGVRVDHGQILLDGDDLLAKSQSQMRHVRGRRVSMVMQDPSTSLDPSFTIKSQLAEAYRWAGGLPKNALHEACLDGLRRVGIPEPETRLNQYPHQLSGGMCQRVTSAIALAGEPDVLIADEPTTALDVTTQARYLRLLQTLQAAKQFALILISHDLHIVRQMCTRLVVMYAGHVVEKGATEDVLASPKHPYTQALFESVPKLDPDAELHAIPGQPPVPGQYPSGCRFAPRCSHAREICTTTPPALSPRDGQDRRARCYGTEADGWIAGPELVVPRPSSNRSQEFQ